MSFFFGDSFDLYAQPSDAVAGYWDPVSANPSNLTLVPGRFSGSRAMSWSYVGSTLIKTSSVVTDAVHHFVLAWFQAYNPQAANYDFYITLFDGTTPQCSIQFRTDGAILLVAGAASASPTVLATYNGANTVGNVWTAFEIAVQVHNTAGYMKVSKNGNPNLDFDSTILNPVLNTRASANNYANKIQLGSVQNISFNRYIDDFLWRSDASTVPWVGDIRCYTRHPNSDVSVQFSRTSAAVNALMWSPAANLNYPAGLATYMQFTASYSGLLTGANFGTTATGGTGHIKAAVFSNISGTVGSVLAAATEVTNPTSVLLSFPTPAYLTAGQVYWIGMICDTSSIQVGQTNSPGPNMLAILSSSAIPYASWPVSNPGAPPTTGNAIGLTLIFTPQSNSDAVGELQQDLTVNYVYSSTNGQADFYAIGSITGAPIQIVGVTTRGFFEKSDAGTRNASVQLKSGSTTVQGPNTALSTNWGWIYRNDLVDPATAAVWTVTAVNNVQVGPIITA